MIHAAAVMMARALAQRYGVFIRAALERMTFASPMGEADRNTPPANSRFLVTSRVVATDCPRRGADAVSV